jgi:hypothetical protein
MDTITVTVGCLSGDMSISWTQFKIVLSREMKINCNTLSYSMLTGWSVEPLLTFLFLLNGLCYQYFVYYFQFLGFLPAANRSAVFFIGIQSSNTGCYGSSTTCAFSTQTVGTSVQAGFSTIAGIVFKQHQMDFASSNSNVYIYVNCRLN